MNQNLREIILKLKKMILPAGFFYAAFMVYDYETDFKESPESPFVQQTKQLKSIQEENVKSKKKVEEANAFYRSLDAKKTEIRNLANELANIKGSISDDADVPGLLSTLAMEGKKSGVRINSIQPSGEGKQEFYTSQDYVLDVKGIYFQVIFFLQRLTSLTKIIRIDNFSFIPDQAMGPGVSSSFSKKYIQLSGKLTLQVFRYNQSHADEVARKVSENRLDDLAPGTPSVKSQLKK